jgi:phosphoribosylformylglycinamidine synthase subunit PurQ / glutaminase
VKASPKAAVITFPGSNCDSDCVYALELMGFCVEQLWHKDKPDVSSFDLIVLPGGFSYGDYLRCGAIAALAPIQACVHDHAAKGKLVLGICNGFQILCEMKLLPGGLVRNEQMKFLSTDVDLRVENTTTPWTTAAKTGSVWNLPIAHGDGRFVCTPEELSSLKRQNQIVLRYCNASGQTPPESNLNGSTDAIAGITNARGNVFGLMPHPERATDLRSGHGRVLWQSILKSLGVNAV